MNRQLRIATAVLATVFLAACDENPVQAPIAPTSGADFAAAGPNVVNITSRHLDFVTSADELASGWNTFRFKNRSDHTHFIFLQRLPVFEGEQITTEDYVEDLAKPFQNFMDFLIGRGPTFPESGFDFPAWAPDFIGGSGLVSPGATSDFTVNLEPGLYVIECYVKTPDGLFHTVVGMVEDFTVGEKSNRAGPPNRTSARLILSVEDGITMQGSVRRPGTHTFEVFFESQTFYDNFVQHDVHLVRLDDDTDLDQLASWMDYRDIDDPNYPEVGGLVTPAPATFLGGVQESPAGTTTYFQAHLQKGNYAWIAEIPAADLLAANPGDPDWIVPFSVE